MKINAQLMLDDSEKNFSIPLSSTVLATLVDLLPDNVANTEVFDYLAGHADSAVRMAIAEKEFLPAGAIKHLLNDASIDVLKKLLSSRTARGQLGTIEALALCRRDPDLAETIAYCYEDFAQCDESVIGFLETHADTKVRLGLASNCLVPKWVLQRMAKNDLDSEVRDSARYVMT